MRAWSEMAGMNGRWRRAARFAEASTDPPTASREWGSEAGLGVTQAMRPSTSKGSPSHARRIVRIPASASVPRLLLPLPNISNSDSL